MATTLLFALCMAAIAIGVLLSGKAVRGSCGGIATDVAGKNVISDGCGVCVKKSADVCSSSDENGTLVKLATLGVPKRPDSHH